MKWGEGPLDSSWEPGVDAGSCTWLARETFGFQSFPKPSLLALGTTRETTTARVGLGDGGSRGSSAGPWEARAASSLVQMKERLRERLTWVLPRLRFPARIPPLLSLGTYRGESPRPGGRREPGSRTQKPRCKGLEPSLIFFFLMLVFPMVCVLLS